MYEQLINAGILYATKEDAVIRWTSWDGLRRLYEFSIDGRGFKIAYEEAEEAGERLSDYVESLIHTAGVGKFSNYSGVWDRFTFITTLGQ